MKPRVFIGSSVEGLDIAYSIQENLSYDANCTVWTQGIFKLSNYALDSLINALENFDFGIFVFNPDDIINIRSVQFNSVRDNVVFELGLFIGKLGKERVFYVTPDKAENFHLPSDLQGVIAGKYELREDGNLLAALGPFCNQIRQKTKDFIYQSLVDLTSESKEVKQIAFEKKPCWEMHLCAELLRNRMIEINRSFEEISKGYSFKRTQEYDISGAIKWFRLMLADFQRIFDIAKDIYLIELKKSFGPDGVEGNIFEIKGVVDKIASLCKELLAWEVDVQAVTTPDDFNEIPTLMKGWSNIIIKEFTKLPLLLNEGFSEKNILEGNPINIELVFDSPPNADRISDIMARIEHKANTGLFNY